MSPGGIGGGRGGGGTRWMGGTGNQQYTAMVCIQKRFFGDDSANSTPVCPERWARMQRGAKWTGVLGTQKLEGLRCTFSPYGGEGELLHTNGGAQWVCMGDVNGDKAASLPAATHGGCTGFSLILTSSCVWASVRRRREEDSRGHLGGICFPFSAVTLFSIHALGGVDLLSLWGRHALYSCHRRSLACDIGLWCDGGREGRGRGWKNPLIALLFPLLSRVRKAVRLRLETKAEEELLMVENRKGENFVVGGGGGSGVSELGEEACGKRRRGGGEKWHLGGKEEGGERAAAGILAPLSLRSWYSTTPYSV